MGGFCTRPAPPSVASGAAEADAEAVAFLHFQRLAKASGQDIDLPVFVSVVAAADPRAAARSNAAALDTFARQVMSCTAVVLGVAYALRRRPGYFVLWFAPVIVALFGAHLWVPISLYRGAPVAAGA